MEWGCRAAVDMEGEGEVKGGADVDYVKGLKKFGKRKEATKSLERGKRQQGVSKEVTSKKH